MKKQLIILSVFATATMPLCAQEIPMADQPVPVAYDDRFGSYFIGGLKDIEIVEEGISSDFGIDVSFDVEKKITPRFDVSLGVNLRTQDNSRKMERRMISVGMGYKLIDTRKFDLKAGFNFDYYGMMKLAERENYEKLAEHYATDNITGEYIDKNKDGVVPDLDGYNYRKGYKITDSYWRGRERYSLSLSASYKPSKRWTFTLKETFQYSHYNTTDSLDRTRYTEVRHKWREAWKAEDDIRGMADPRTGDDLLPLYYDSFNYSINGDGDALYTPANKPERALPFADEDKKAPRRAKDKLVLRSKLTIEYNVKGVPLNPFASVDYGCGLNYSTSKWKYTVGLDWKITKTNKFTIFYRYQHENDDDEPNGNLLGIGYKINL
ncbi:MAG: DUF2490 domain-containing protein [Bacteroidaceae bacterium]|nr:DUF2490 domain-containing protein [Bacteroidaceae bacterium]